MWCIDETTGLKEEIKTKLLWGIPDNIGGGGSPWGALTDSDWVTAALSKLSKLPKCAPQRANYTALHAKSKPLTGK